VTDWAQMARKTVIRRARHYWPISVEMAHAAELDDRVDVGSYVPDDPGVVDGGKLDAPEMPSILLICERQPRG
jgi:recombinational DNA repair protein RecT